MKDVNILTNNGVNVEQSLELFGDMEMYDETLQDFLDMVDEKLGLLDKYKELSDMANYAIEVHSLKSDARYLGFTSLADMSYDSELKSKAGDVMYVQENHPKIMTEAKRIIGVAKKYMGIETPNEENKPEEAAPQVQVTPSVPVQPAQPQNMVQPGMNVQQQTVSQPVMNNQMPSVGQAPQQYPGQQRPMTQGQMYQQNPNMQYMQNGYMQQGYMPQQGMNPYMQGQMYQQNPNMQYMQNGYMQQGYMPQQGMNPYMQGQMYQQNPNMAQVQKPQMPVQNPQMMNMAPGVSQQTQQTNTQQNMVNNNVQQQNYQPQQPSGQASKSVQFFPADNQENKSSVQFFSEDPMSQALNDEIAAKEQAMVSQPKADQKEGTILIVDDSNLVVNFVKKIFDAKYNVMIANDGAKAIELLDNETIRKDIKACLLDLNMPNVDGYQVLEHCKQNGYFVRMPVAVESGVEDMSSLDKVNNYPIVDILSKPFNERDVQRVIEKCLATYF